jgi:hypothetical protein
MVLVAGLEVVLEVVAAASGGGIPAASTSNFTSYAAFSLINTRYIYRRFYQQRQKVVP